jgi:hypothetical protein
VKIADLREKLGEIAEARSEWDMAVASLQNDDEVPKADLLSMYKDSIGFLVRNNLIEEALIATDGHLEVLKDEGQFSFAHKEILAKVVLVLHLNQDTVRAQDMLDSGTNVDGWLQCREHTVGSNLIEAFRANDAEAVENLVKDQMFSFLQVEVARVARRLRVPVAKAQAPSSSATHEPSSEAPEQSNPQSLGALLM